MKELIKYILYKIPFCPGTISFLKYMFDVVTSRNHSERTALKEFQETAERLFAEPINDGRKGKALFLGLGRVDFIVMESFFLKSFEMAGFKPSVLVDLGYLNKKTYQSLGHLDIEYFKTYCPLPSKSKARGLLNKVNDFKTLLELKYKNIHVGKYTASTLMRRFRGGNLSLDSLEVKAEVENHLARSMSYVDAAFRVISVIRPKAAVFVDRGYSPGGEFFEVLIQNSIPCFTWNAGHKDQTLILKRYSEKNEQMHPSSLSLKSWKMLKGLNWDQAKSRKIHDEVFEAYQSGQWYCEVGTQFNKQMPDAQSIIQTLKLDPSKKIAVIFSHIFWDATFFWGEDLFEDYEDWFVQTLKAACRNDRVNWIVKIHPANVTKDKRDGIKGEPAEIMAIKENFGTLPDHIKLLPADTSLSTFSLMQTMHYGITVRGTVGIEASMLGKQVLTAGTGRYDRMGFTRDFSSTEDYLKSLVEIENIPLPSEDVTELAEKYAYGVFLSRPISITSMEIAFEQDEQASLKTQWKLKDFGQLKNADDLAMVSDWIRSGDEDFLSL